MERMTQKWNDGYAINLPNALSEKDETLEWHISERENGMRLEGDIPNRLAAIEDILGDDYDLDRLRELVSADKDGRCFVSDVKLGGEVFYISDEELAIFLSENSWGCNECKSGQENMDNPFATRCDEKCAEHCLEWLQQPYKGE